MEWLVKRSLWLCLGPVGIIILLFLAVRRLRRRRACLRCGARMHEVKTHAEREAALSPGHLVERRIASMDHRVLACPRGHGTKVLSTPRASRHVECPGCGHRTARWARAELRHDGRTVERLICVNCDHLEHAVSGRGEDSDSSDDYFDSLPGAGHGMGPWNDHAFAGADGGDSGGACDVSDSSSASDGGSCDSSGGGGGEP